MRILLVHVPRFTRGPGGIDSIFVNIPAMGLYGISAHLRRVGHEPSILHVGVERARDPTFRLDRVVRREGWPLIGLSIHWHHQLHDSLQTAAELKRRCPGVYVVAGGLTASAFASELLAVSADLDFVIRGEGEGPLAALATALERGGSIADVPNLTYRSRSGVVQNPIGFVADERFFAGLTFADTTVLRRPDDARQPYYYFDASARDPGDYFAGSDFYLAIGRGCTRECGYCGGAASAHRMLSGRAGVTFRPHDAVVADLHLIAENGYKAAYVCFDPPPAAHEWYMELFRRLDGSGLPIGLIFEAYVPHGEEFWRAMTRAFAADRSLVAFSPDTESEESRMRIRRYSYANAALEQELACLKGIGLQTGLYFSVVPGEGVDQARRTTAWIGDLADRFGSFSWAHAIDIEPYSDWARDPERWGLRNTRRGLDEYLAWHRAPRDPDAGGSEVGYEMDDFEEVAAILKACERRGM
jgi:radical SAM superfamily enzyme YgiQ (UPF0313 family)